MRGAMLLAAVCLGGCSVIVPGPDEFTYRDGTDAGPDAGDRPVDAGSVDAGDPDMDGGPGCGAGEMRCDGSCVDTSSSADHCGMCGRACAVGEVCAAGECAETVVDIAAGPHHTCAVTQSGAVWCWGANATGPLGTGGTFDSAIPVRVEGIGPAAAVSCSGPFPRNGPAGNTCVVLRSGEVYCWGGFGDAFTGPTGSGFDIVPTPFRVAVPSASAIALSWLHGCVRGISNQLYCWGSTLSGVTESAPREVGPSGILGVWNGEVAGSAHTCGMTSLGAIACRGPNGIGQLGEDPSTVPSLPDFMLVQRSIDDVNHVAVSTFGTCVSRRAGPVLCWGSGASTGGGADWMTPDPTPREVPGIRDVRSLWGSAWGGVICASEMDGDVVCWGVDFSGASLAPQPLTQIEGASGATDVALGLYHMCVLIDGSVRCSGRNEFGEVGDGTMVERTLLTQVRFPVE